MDLRVFFETISAIKCSLLQKKIHHSNIHFSIHIEIGGMFFSTNESCHTFLLGTGCRSIDLIEMMKNILRGRIWTVELGTAVKALTDSHCKIQEVGRLIICFTLHFNALDFDRQREKMVLQYTYYISL